MKQAMTARRPSTKADGDSMEFSFSAGQREKFATRQEVAQRILVSIDSLESILAPNGNDRYGCRASLYVIKSAVMQVAGGIIPSIHFGVTEQVLALQAKVNQSYSHFSTQTGYKEVIKACDDLKKARELFLALDAINVALVNYGPDNK